MTTPDTIGPQHIRAAEGTDPRGVLVFDWLPRDLQNAEDSTQNADRERRVIYRRGPRELERDATPTELILLQHLGYDTPEGLQTVVKWPSVGVRHRSWPSIGA